MFRGVVLGWKAGLTSIIVLAIGNLACAKPAVTEPDFQEVAGLIRARLPEVTPAELDHAAVQGILSGLGDKVAFIPEQNGGDTNVLLRTNLFEGAIGYARVGSVTGELPDKLRQAWASLSATNRLKGLVLDVRYAGGNDYAAVAKAVSLFVNKQEPLLDFGQGVVESRPGAERISVPVAVLINGATTSAAEALAAVLRETGVGLLLGSKTAGKAMMYSEHSLKTGGKLRLFQGPIRLGDGKELAGGAVTPDIAVDVAAAEERAFYADAFRAPTNGAAALNTSGRRIRYNEAELARERREGGSGEPATARARRPEPDKPAVSDPVLARALDLLKGLAVVRKTEP